MARPTVLTAQVHDRLVELVRAGNTFEVAARASGISRATFYRWKQEGKKAGKGAKYKLFVALELAEAECEAYWVGRIKLAGITDWKADAWMLERRHPGRWGRRRFEREDLDVDGEGQQLGTELITDKKTRESHLELLRNAARARQGKSGGTRKRN